VKLLWCDVETTGLDSRRDDLLEVAFGVADLERPFELRAQPHSPYPDVESYVVRWWKPLAMEPFVLAMHAGSGLLADLEVARVGIERPSVGTADDLGQIDLLAARALSGEKRGSVVLAGFSVYFDLGFVRAHMPRTAELLSHKVYDVSAVKLFCQSLGMPKLPRAEAHRAAADVLESVEHARLCARWLQSEPRGPGVGW